MALPTLYYSDLCPDTEPFVAALREHDIAYQSVNITASMANLKQFLALRDAHPHFEHAKREGYVGIPTLQLEGGRLISDSTELATL